MRGVCLPGPSSGGLLVGTVGAPWRSPALPLQTDLHLGAWPGRACPLLSLLHLHSSTLTAGWRLEVLERPQDAAVRAGAQACFTCVLSEAVPVGEATWYVNGAAVQPDDEDWTVTADGSHHTLLLCNAQPHHAGEVTFAARDAVTSARLTVLGGWLTGSLS